MIVSVHVVVGLFNELFIGIDQSHTVQRNRRNNSANKPIPLILQQYALGKMLLMKDSTAPVVISVFLSLDFLEDL